MNEKFCATISGTISYLSSIKFSKREIALDVINDVQEKIKHLKIPKSFSCIPVLIHANGVTEALEDAGFFYRIINFSDFLIA